jgi:hypothetical protein
VAGVDEKMRRADEHREPLKGMIRTYLEGHEDRFRVEIDDQGRWRRFGDIDETPARSGPSSAM